MDQQFRALTENRGSISSTHTIDHRLPNFTSTGTRHIGSEQTYMRAKGSCDKHEHTDFNKETNSRSGKTGFAGLTKLR